jgi:hypothetical protein
MPEFNKKLVLSVLRVRAVHPAQISSFFFLQEWMLFSYLGAATCVSVDPSGLVPGVIRDGHV